ncbi:GNAT family N-acetyltransferase [Oricola sp.]|uniref:GNAT family N-acetyltransferase n=1 Tax=Oricola sp. TaxID=1979950 RepID=UPI003BAA7879
MPIRVRRPARSELPEIVRLWHAGWMEAHAAITPLALTRLRTPDDFARRGNRHFDAMRVTGPKGSPDGLCIINGDELDQLYVAPQARGAGTAAALVRDAEARLRDNGISGARLLCAIGNDRAARFYEKMGWRHAGTVVAELETDEGPFELETWLYEKDL